MAKPPPFAKLPHWWPLLMAQFAAIETRLAAIEADVSAEEENLMAFIDDLEASVAREKTVDDSVLALLASIAQALKDAGVDPARQAAVLASLQSEQDRIAAAVTANTPAAPA